VLIGTIGSTRRADVQGGGVLVVNQGTTDEISISWLVGADDRWYAPEREITARQHLIRNTPIVSTSVRIPSGDAISTHFGATQSQRELAVIDIENRSKVPFVIALLLRGPGVHNVTIANTVVKVGGFPFLHLAKKPTKCAAVSVISGPGDALDPRDLEALVTSGDATDVLPIIEGPSEVAVLFPVTHGTTVRSGVLLGVGNVAALAGSPVLSSLGEIHTLANGWQTHLRRSAVLNVPENEVLKQFDAATASLLLCAEPAIAQGGNLATFDVAALSQALAEAGFSAECGALLEDIDDRQTSKGAVADRVDATDADLQSALMVRSVATHAMFTNDRLFAESLTPVVAGACEFLAKRAKKSGEANLLAALWWAAVLFDVGRDVSAAKQARRLWVDAQRPWPLPEAPLPQLPASSSGGVLVAADRRRVAALVRTAIASVVTLRPTEDRDAKVCVDLLPGYGDDWRGQKVDVRNLAVPGGFLSFSIRWHGERPAILWDVLDGDANTCQQINWTLTCTMLDPTWSSTLPKGEDLLRK
jgi:hypothetical protein